MVRTFTRTGAHSPFALVIAFGVMFELSAAARTQAAPCVADVQLVATNEMTVPALAGYQLAGYWDVAGDGFGSSTAGNANMGLFYKMADDPTKCLQTLCLKASDEIDPGLPDSYTRVGKWDVDGGGSQAICGSYDGTNSYGLGTFSRGKWMMGMYKRPYTGPGSRVIESIHVTASDSDKVLAAPDHTWVAAWDVDRGGGVGSKDGSTNLSLAALNVVDFAVLSWATERIVYQSLELGEQGGARVDGVLNDLGVSEQNLRIVRENLGEHVFVVRGAKYKAVTKGFYVEDTTINEQITRMFYANGTCLFLIE